MLCVFAFGLLLGAVAIDGDWLDVVRPVIEKRIQKLVNLLRRLNCRLFRVKQRLVSSVTSHLLCLVSSALS